MIAVFAVVLGVAALLRPAAAATLDPSQLNAIGWSQAYDAPDHKFACNYLYTDFSGNLLYYGTSGNCRGRYKGHARAIQAAVEIYQVVDAWLQQKRIAAGFSDYMKDWSKVTRGNRESKTGDDTNMVDDETVRPPPADACMAIQLQRGKYRFYYIQLDNKDQAAKVETYVLTQMKGACNSNGKGRLPDQLMINQLRNYLPDEYGNIGGKPIQ